MIRYACSHMIAAAVSIADARFAPDAVADGHAIRRHLPAALMPFDAYALFR